MTEGVRGREHHRYIRDLEAVSNLKYTSGLGAATGFEKTRTEIGGSLRGVHEKRRLRSEPHNPIHQS